MPYITSPHFKSSRHIAPSNCIPLFSFPDDHLPTFLCFTLQFCCFAASLCFESSVSMTIPFHSIHSLLLVFFCCVSICFLLLLYVHSNLSSFYFRQFFLPSN